jgi:hypothetical protein
MPQIDIDFEVFKELTIRRPTEAFSYNAVIRELLKLPKQANATKSATNDSKPWVVLDTTFPAGSEFLATYKSKTYTGIVRDGLMELSDGQKFAAPSAAAVHITGNSVNGWRFWKCKLPGSSQFVLLERLRGKAH